MTSIEDKIKAHQSQKNENERSFELDALRFIIAFGAAVQGDPETFRLPTFSDHPNFDYEKTVSSLDEIKTLPFGMIDFDVTDEEDFYCNDTGASGEMVTTLTALIRLPGGTVRWAVGRCELGQVVRALVLGITDEDAVENCLARLDQFAKDKAERGYNYLCSEVPQF